MSLPNYNLNISKEKNISLNLFSTNIIFSVFCKEIHNLKSIYYIFMGVVFLYIYKSYFIK